MNTTFEIITLQDAIAQYRIHENIYESTEVFEDFIEADSRFYLHRGDLVLEKDLLLVLELHGVAGYIIDGNLLVNGNIVNEEGDYGPVFYVKGNVVCRSLLIGGSPTHITGNVSAEEVIMLHYNHGWMKCPGLFTAPVMVVEDYHFIPDHKNISLFYYNDEESDNPEEEDIAEVLNNKLTTTFEELRYDLAAGEYVLSQLERDAQYWQKKVNHNYRDLKRVPPEMRTKELCLLALNKSVSALEDFPPALITEEMVEYAVNKSGMALRYLPETLITRELCYKAAVNGAIINLDIPERFYEAALLQLLIQHSDWQMERIPVDCITEDLLVTYVKHGRGAWLEKYCTAAGISKERILQRVIEADVAYLENIFSWFFSADTFAYSQSLYDNEQYSNEWTAITTKYKRKLERLK
ncbi:hypothetical protein [Chitinophaga sancti]|uniref:hypothetical protein n=1 Tax=Chitinophaga sancti TaxID=1004 RepID=UPI003F7AFAF2